MGTTEADLMPDSSSGGTTEELGFGGKLWNLLSEPRKTFAAVKPNHEWIILWLLVSVVTLGAYWPVRDIVKQDQMARLEEQFAQMAPEQKAEMLARVEGQFDNPAYALFGPAFQAIGMVIVAGILLFIANILLGGTGGYLRMLNAYAWVGIISIPAALVWLILVKMKGSSDVSLGLGVLTSADTGAFVKAVLTQFEIFGLWKVWLSSVAVSVIAGVDSRKALWSVVAVWLVWVLVQGGLATLGMQFGM